MSWCPGRIGRGALCATFIALCFSLSTWANSSNEPEPCTPDPPRRWFLGLGQMKVDRDNLNTELTAAGYGGFEDRHFAVSFLGYTRPRGRWILGGSAAFSCQVVSGQSGLEARTCSEPWTAQLGYVVVDHPTLTVFPYAGLGLMIQSLTVTRDAAVDFDDQLRYPIGEAKFNSVIPTLSIGVHVDNLIILKVSEHRASGLALGVRVEYEHGLSENDWMSRHRRIEAAPMVTASSWSVSFLLGWGSQQDPGGDVIQ